MRTGASARVAKIIATKTYARWLLFKAPGLDYVQRVPASLELRREFPFVIEFGVGDDKEFAGVISLHTISIDNHRAEIGYWMHTPMRGKGIGTIAAKMITDYGFRTIGFRRIDGLAEALNTGVWTD